MVQKKGNAKSGSEMQRDKDAVATLMREKQKKGKHPLFSSTAALLHCCSVQA